MTRVLWVLASLVLLIGCGGKGSFDPGLPRARAKNDAPTVGPVDFYLQPTTGNQQVDITFLPPTATSLAASATSSYTTGLEGQYEFIFTQTGTKTVIDRAFRFLPFETSTTGVLTETGIEFVSP